MAGRQQFLVVTISVYCTGALRLQPFKKKKGWTRLKTGAALIELWMIDKGKRGQPGAVADRSMAGRAEPSWNPVW
ncbi:hypothetical protein DFJ73DRAFT_876317 [Zopfochytrium polystomum]|nr:hypothetical protein DFJ73DRAFT_880954 [Zopfochytrium polystomum]KAI9321197.1 hypothetical protein DFJ73DRAFT_876317 [Zopfochytrium polystomum]